MSQCSTVMFLYGGEPIFPSRITCCYEFKKISSIRRILSWPDEDKLLAMSLAKLSKELPLKLGCLSSASSDVKSQINEQMLAAIITTHRSSLPSAQYSKAFRKLENVDNSGENPICFLFKRIFKTVSQAKKMLPLSSSPF